MTNGALLTDSSLLHQRQVPSEAAVQPPSGEWLHLVESGRLPLLSGRPLSSFIAFETSHVPCRSFQANKLVDAVSTADVPKVFRHLLHPAFSLCMLVRQSIRGKA